MDTQFQITGGGAKYTVVGKYRFSAEIAVYLGNYTRWAQVADRSMLVPITLSDLERRDARVKVSGESL